MTVEKLKGALVSLERVGAPQIDGIHDHFQQRELFLEAGLYKPPAKKSLLEDLDEQELFLWQMIPEGCDEAVGYVGVVGYSGPTYIFVHFFDQKAMDVDLAQDAMTPVVKIYFQTTNEESLWTYLPKPINHEIHDRLIEGGFDHWDEDVPGIDREQTSCYIMERHTFDAYYEDSEEY